MGKHINIKHGMSTTRQYSIWRGMKTRCTNKNQPNFARYGQRGISYDPKWATFEGFWNDMGGDYYDGLTLERRDNGGSYTKDNCVWVTPREQNLNMRSNVLLPFNGILKPLTQWAAELGLERRRLYSLRSRHFPDGEIISIAINEHSHDGG